VVVEVLFRATERGVGARSAGRRVWNAFRVAFERGWGRGVAGVDLIARRSVFRRAVGPRAVVRARRGTCRPMTIGLGVAACVGRCGSRAGREAKPAYAAVVALATKPSPGAVGDRDVADRHAATNDRLSQRFSPRCGLVPPRQPAVGSVMAIAGRWLGFGASNLFGVLTSTAGRSPSLRMRWVTSP